MDAGSRLVTSGCLYSTAIKNTSDMLRHSLRTERALNVADDEDLTQLTIIEISPADALRLRQENADEIAPPGPAETAENAPDGAVEHEAEQNEKVEEGEDDLA